MKVCVIGGGPAGMSAALYLCSEGADVTLIERFSENGYDRYHSICGAGISRKAFSELKYIEPVCVRNDIRRAELHFPGGIDVPMSVKGYVLDRPAFIRHYLHICREKGCITVRGEAEDVRDDGSSCTVLMRDGSEIACDKVIACDGSSSLIRKRVFGTSPRYIGSAEEFVTDGPSEPVFHMYLEGRLNGAYRWEFPSGDNRNVGSVAGKYRPDSFSSRGIRNIPTGGVPEIEKGNVFLAGDSAAMANPICYGGLRAALLAGQEAAKAALSGKSGRYTRWWRHSMMSNHRFSMMKEEIDDWTDEDYRRVAEPMRNMTNLWLTGIKASILHPGYVHLYIGCLMTFRYGW